MLQIYFLFLIKDNFSNLKIWKNYFKNAYNYQIIIHPKKYKNNYLDLNEIVLYPIETKWGDISLVDAEIYLLKKALAISKSSKSYLILLSDDSIPIHSYNKFYKFLNSKTLSFFNYSRYLLGSTKYKEFTFSSQFFCVNNKDAQIVVNNYQKYRDKILNFKNIYSPDETFMLSILFYENKNYQFHDRIITQPIRFYYRKTIPEIDNLIENIRNLKYNLFQLKENNSISFDQNNALESLNRLKLYANSHPFTFLYNEKLVNKFKELLPESFFMRKIVSKHDNKYYFKYEDINKLESFIANNDYINISKYINKAINIKN